jgi:hypothetical protein
MFALTLPSAAFGQDVVSKTTVTIFSDDYDSVKQKVASVAQVDKDTNKIVSNYDIVGKAKQSLNVSVVDGLLIVSNEQIQNDASIATKIKGLMKKNEVFIYGSNLKISDVNKELDLPNSHSSDEQGYNIVGLVNGIIGYVSNITAEDISGNPIPVTSDMIIQNVLRYEDSSKGKPKPIESTKGKKTKKEVHVSDYSTDTIVQSSYSNTSTYYSPDAWGNNILRASLNTDWILKRNTANDNDPNYDYFYVRDNSELYTNTSAATNGYGIHIEHSLPYSSSDNVLDWDPDTKTDASQVAVALPWQVQWQFSVGQSALDIYTNGSQTTDKVTWDVLNNAGTFRYNFDGDYNRLQPGTAWASSGTFAAMDLKNVGSFYYGSTYKELSQTFNIRYDY